MSQPSEEHSPIWRSALLWILLIGNIFAVYGIRKELKEVSATVADLEKKASEVKETGFTGDDKESLEDLNARFPSAALLTPTDKGYGVIWTKHGQFFVSIENVQPYADGQQVRLRLKNGAGVGFSGFRVIAEYGPKLTQKLKTKETQIANSLGPGRFIDFDIFLGDCKVADLKILLISLKMDVITSF